MENHHFCMGNIQKTMDNHHFFMGNIQKTTEHHRFFMAKSTNQMAIFNSYVNIYQRVYMYGNPQKDKTIWKPGKYEEHFFFERPSWIHVSILWGVAIYIYYTSGNLT